MGLPELTLEASVVMSIYNPNAVEVEMGRSLELDAKSGRSASVMVFVSRRQAEQ